MSPKLKLLVAVLALGTLFSASYVFSSFGAPKNSGAANILAQATPLGLGGGDTDKDGLSDRDESYWQTDYRKADTDGDGFVDGEEVMSGHDPLKKGPNDFLDPGKNLTQRTSELMLGGMLTGDLKPGTANYDKSIQRLTDEVMRQYQENSVVQADPFVTVPKTQKALITYGFTMSRLLQDALNGSADGLSATLSTVSNIPVEQLSSLPKDPARYSLFTAAIDKEIRSLDGYAQQIARLSVPENMASTHTSVLLFIRQFQQQYRLLRNIKTDPIQSLLALQRLKSLSETTTITILALFMQEIEKGINQ